MNPGSLIPTRDALNVLLKQYYAGTASQAQLDCLVEHGLLKTDKGAYWATGRAALPARNQP